MIVSKIDYLTPEVFKLLPCEDYQTKRFLFKNNLIGLPLKSVFTQYASNFEPLSILARNIRFPIYLYRSCHQELIIPECQFHINEHELITKYIKNSGKYDEFAYDQNHRKIYHKSGWHDYSRSYFEHRDDCLIEIKCDAQTEIKKKPQTIKIYNKFGFLKEVRELITEKMITASKYDEVSNIIESKNYIYKNIYCADAPDLLDYAEITPKGAIDPKFIMQYEYDGYGNWIRRTITNLYNCPSNPIIENRRIIYKNNRLHSITNDQNSMIYKVED